MTMRAFAFGLLLSIVPLSTQGRVPGQARSDRCGGVATRAPKAS